VLFFDVLFICCIPCKLNITAWMLCSSCTDRKLWTIYTLSELLSLLFPFPLQLGDCIMHRCSIGIAARCSPNLLQLVLTKFAFANLHRLANIGWQTQTWSTPVEVDWVSTGLRCRYCTTGVLVRPIDRGWGGAIDRLPLGLQLIRPRHDHDSTTTRY